MGFKYIFLLNGDATVEPEALGALVGASASLKDEAILGSAVKYAETGNYQFFGSRTRKDVGHPEWLNTADDQIALQRALIETDFVFGAALFVPATILRRTGLFDERLPGSDFPWIGTWTPLYRPASSISVGSHRT